MKDEADGFVSFFVVEDTGYGSTVAGPYARERDAKGVRTRLLKQHG